MLFLKQSTASQSVLIGPFVDSTDGVTAETGLTIANTDIRLSANGGNMFSKTSGGGTHDEAGWYTITLDATDTATVGRLQLSVAVSGALPVFAEFQVLEEAIYDDLFGTGAALAKAADLATVDGIVDDILLDTAEIGAAGAGLTAINLPDQTMNITGNITGNLSGSVGSVTGAVGSVTGAVGSVTGAVGSVAGNVDGNVTGSVGSNLELGPAEVNAEVLDVLNTDTFAEPGQEAPAATNTLVKKIGYIFKFLRNKITQTSTTMSVFADDTTTVDQKATVSDDGTTYTRGEIGTGP